MDDTSNVDVVEILNIKIKKILCEEPVAFKYLVPGFYSL